MLEANITFPKSSNSIDSRDEHPLNAPLASVTSFVAGKLKPSAVKDSQLANIPFNVKALKFKFPIFLNFLHPSNIESFGNVTILFLSIDEVMLPTSSSLSHPKNKKRTPHPVSLAPVKFRSPILTRLEL